MDKYIIAYAYGEGIYNINEEDARKLTHINIAFGTLDKNGLLSREGLQHMDAVGQIREWNPNIKIVLSVGGWGAGGFSTMAKTLNGRRAFANSCLSFIDEYKLDGLDIDWEYPGIDWAGIDASGEDKNNFTLLMKELRKNVGNDRILSIAAGAEQYYLDNTQMDIVAQICDYVQIMTYDMRGDGYPTTGHHTALYAGANDTTKKSVHDSVHNFMKAGVPAGKIVIGAAFYARMWKGVEGNDNRADGLMMSAKECGFYGASYTQLVNEYIDKNGFVSHRDETARAPYLFDGETFISYDDPKSIAEKCQYIKDNDLLGIMYWEHGLDETHTLIKSIDFR
ncbi:MAG: glycoside hydrolase family 18 protein [Lachnospiraceae bacterium]|nr:glycoside hydrolase family 18 protein [Lachnospiraceae bacterium]